MANQRLALPKLFATKRDAAGVSRQRPVVRAKCPAPTLSSQSGDDPLNVSIFNSQALKLRPCSG